jgi:predicted HTH transcriptional regulator
MMEKEMNSLQNSIIPFWQQPESRRLEFKETFPKGDQIARTAVAFANGAGGKIVFGVRNDPREIVGIPDNEIFSLEEKISGHVFDRCLPAIIPEIYIQAIEGKHLLVVEIFPGSQKPYYLKSIGKRKGTYVRIGSSNRLASQEILEALEREKRKISFDAIPVHDLSSGDIDFKRFKADYKKATGRNLTGQNLKTMGLLVSERDQVRPTPGPLPDTLPIEELGTGRSEIRNRVLAPIFKELKLIEAWGTGIRKMRNEVSEYPEIELVLHEVGHAFQVQFRKREVGVRQLTRTGQVAGHDTEQVGTKSQVKSNACCQYLSTRL